MSSTATEQSGNRAAKSRPWWRRALLCAALCAAALLSPAARGAHADPHPENDSDSLIIKIAPLTDIGVIIDTASVNLTFNLAMGATAYTLNPATVTVVGNFQPQELDISAQNVAASPLWTLDTDEVAAEDQIQIYGLFAADRQSPPSEAEFAGAKNLITGTVKRAGKKTGQAADGNFENNSMAGGADMDNILLQGGAGPARQMWLRIDTPPLTTTDQTQDLQIAITATRTNL